MERWRTFTKEINRQLNHNQVVFNFSDRNLKKASQTEFIDAA